MMGLSRERHRLNTTPRRATLPRNHDPQDHDPVWETRKARMGGPSLGRFAPLGSQVRWWFQSDSSKVHTGELLPGLMQGLNRQKQKI